MRQMTVGEKSRYLYEHLAYEVLMLRHSYSSLGSAKGLDFNMALENVALHARQLVEFLTEKPKCRGKDVRACLYAPDFKALRKDGIRSTLAKLDEQIMHLARGRTNKPDEKFHTNLATELWEWAEQNIAMFNDALPKPYSKGWLPPGAAPAPLPATAAPSATNHCTTTTTYVVARMNFNNK